MSDNKFGPATERVREFIASLNSVEWLTKIETPHPKDAGLKRVSLESLLDAELAEGTGATAQDPWGGLIGRSESAFERLIFDNARLAYQEAVLKAVGEPIDPGPVLDLLLERYDGYYKDSFTYAHELIDFPDRLIRGAAQEIMVSDLDPSLCFFQNLMPWFREGYWPCGWSGEWPDGKLMLI